MSVYLKGSMDRAICLMRTPYDYENYISIKIKPVNGECCCFRHKPKTWVIVNEYIYPLGPLKNEGDVLLGHNNERFVLECHESGPEIIVYRAALISLATSIINLIIVLLKALEIEEHRNPGKLKITKRVQIKGQVKEEEIIEIDFPLSKSLIKKLKNSIKKAIG